MEEYIKVQKVKHLVDICSDIKCQNQDLNLDQHNTSSILLAMMKGQERELEWRGVRSGRGEGKGEGAREQEWERETTFTYNFIICCSQLLTLFCENKYEIIRFSKPNHLNTFQIGLQSNDILRVLSKMVVTWWESTSHDYCCRVGKLRNVFPQCIWENKEAFHILN